MAAPLAILALGAAVAAALMATKPVAGKAAPQAKSVLVQVLPATVTDQEAAIEVMGVVAPAREITLRARVAGCVQALGDTFVPGGRLRQGERVVALDDADYRLAVRQAQSAVDTAQASLDLEMGQQRVAQAQLDMLAQAAGAVGGDTSLALRQPQLAQARATLEDARASLEQARLNLERAAVRAPFNALVTERSVNLGSQVATSDTLATLVGTDEYWVKAAAPVDRLGWLEFSSPDAPGSPVRITARSQSAPVAGRVLRLAGGLIESSRMAQVLISVPDPLGLKRGGPPLLLDEYVTARISGRTMRGVAPLPRAALREEAAVWICAEGKLEIRPVTVAWRDADMVYLSAGVQPGELIVTSDIASPAAGMALRISGGDGAGGRTPEAAGDAHAG
jgi:RND family efflux transporter MFP subunit